MKIKRTPPQPLRTPTSGDVVRARTLADMQSETGRLLSALDQKRKHATVRGLGQTADILRCCYTLIDMAEERP